MYASPVTSDPRLALIQDLSAPTRLAGGERRANDPATASQLAAETGVAATTLANHLRRLRDSGLIEVNRRGRHAVYRLAEPGLRDLLSLLNGLRAPAHPSGREPRVAGRCYDHLAGSLGVAVYDALVDRGALVARDGEGEVQLSARADGALRDFGVRLPVERSRRLPAYACLDATVGRPHLGGAIGAEILAVMEDRGWLERGPSERALEITPRGRRALRQRLGAHYPAS